MSGHSKWHNIQAKKGKADAARGRIFTKIGREIAVAAKQGSDPNLNSKLADAIAKAKAANMPNDNIVRSIKKASGELSATNYESLTYEGYGAGGSAVIVETLTDNKNRTAGDVRHVFDKCGGAMGTTGCVSFMFDRKGVIVVERTATLTEDDMMELAIDCGADDVITEEDAFVVYTNPNDFSEVRKALEEKNLTFLEAAIQQVPQNKTELSPEDTAKFIKMV
ncbi:MAG: YebC/PmpR family DNA-binding transcriptional regulator, partial [Clostridia bacterium]|nr:YebC/PmpR family DNA-binding transcriptional regulator [Clostridia bacterium]